MWQDKRSLEPELLDTGNYTAKEYGACLSLLTRINHLLGGFSATRRALKQLPRTPASFLDVGCGGGYLCHLLAKWYPEARVVGMDISEEALLHANQYANTNVSFTSSTSQAFDVITTLLVTHHMTDDELVAFLKQSYEKCGLAVVINDLQRHFLAYASFSLIAPFLFPNRLIWHDGRLSIRRSFRKKDWIALLKKAEISNYTLKWNFAFRWTLTLRKT